MKGIKPISYKAVGIDRTTIQDYHTKIARLVERTHSYPRRARVHSIIGHYAGLVHVDKTVLALHSDGVGTKVLVSQMLNKFDTVGIDCIAMNVNDIICVGAEPIAFIDYIALKSSNNYIVSELLKGLVRGARIANISIVGGETAILPDIISGAEEDTAYDLAGTVLGVVSRRRRIILGQQIKEGDIIMGVESSGLHSNGYSLARKVLLSKYSIRDRPTNLSQSLGEEMLVPTRIYVKPVNELLDKGSSIPIHGLAHITGGAFTKLLRLNGKMQYNLKDLPPPSGIFKQIAVDGPVRLKEMYRTFNMGIGFCIIAPKESVDPVCKVFRKHRMSCKEIGIVDNVKGRGEVSALLQGRQQVLTN
ncbi:MAG: phosphoribosylformylglycinamidine cyclo-ligase [Thermoproteota archaeon]|nr:phosphoribosylformylglycinamidine cyclo-ligase [Thermoproteota archaeon]